MTYPIRPLEEHLFAPGPKRILALDGGGLRGILTLGYLERLEAILRERHGGSKDFRLAHYFDLIAGTSTGSIIAACLCLGLSVAEVVQLYSSFGRRVFTRSWLRQGILRARYDRRRLIHELKNVFGEQTLGSPQLQTGLLVVSKRLDTGSAWPLTNNPRGRYFEAPLEESTISNADYPLWQVVRASTAAPSFFDPENITIAEQPGKAPIRGDFVDGGVSTANNPALQAFMVATLAGYRLQWPASAEQLLLVSLGTGQVTRKNKPSEVAAAGALKALLSLMDDCADLVEVMLQWMSQSPTQREIDSEIGNLSQDLLGGKPLLSYLRYNTALDESNVLQLYPAAPRSLIPQLAKMDATKTMDFLQELGRLAAAHQVMDDHLPRSFDLLAPAKCDV
jgi:predicted acylesterase/phospholipase RssA